MRGGALARAQPLDHGTCGRNMLCTDRRAQQLSAMGDVAGETGGIWGGTGYRCGAGGRRCAEPVPWNGDLGLLRNAAESCGADLCAVHGAVVPSELPVYFCGRLSAMEVVW